MKNVIEDAWWFVGIVSLFGLTMLTKDYLFSVILAAAGLGLFVADLALANLEE